MINYNTDIQNRASKIYKRKSFDFLLKEMITNAIHSCIISEKIDKPVSLNIIEKDNEYTIEIQDYGEGFTDNNIECFDILDRENINKKNLGFQSFGQGRLSLVYFANQGEYTSYFKENDKIYCRKFNYPKNELFDKNKQEVTKDIPIDLITLLKITINSNDKIDRIKKFLIKYDNIQSIKEYFLVNFFPLIQFIDLQISYKNNTEKLSKTTDFDKETFNIKIEDKEYNFTLYILNADKNYNEIKCFAKGLLCKLNKNDKIIYNLKNINKIFYLESDYFNNIVDEIGENIECEESILNEIKSNIKIILDNKFKNEIAENKNKTNKNLEEFCKKRPSFKAFITKDELTNNDEIDFNEIQKIASQNKIIAESDFWDNKDSKYKNDIIKSGLFTYFKHRENILKLFKDDFLNSLNEDGEKKTQNEDKIHEILFHKQKEIYNNDIDVYFNHNLWLIDDKFSLFKNAKSSIKGENLSDIYLYCDNDNADEIVIIELKSSHKAHNTNEMIKQVNDYAIDIYSQKNNTLQGCITNTEKCRYYGYIIASKDDIEKSIKHARSQGSMPSKIPFLYDSYYIYHKFEPKNEVLVDIKIELISYKDLYYLSNKRNERIINLMYK